MSPVRLIWTSWVVWSLAFVFFYAANHGITCTNDGSHFALTKSLYERHSAELDGNAVLAGHDSAEYEGRRYSDRNPGTAFLVAGFLLVARLLLPAPARLVSDPWSAPDVQSSEALVAQAMLLPPLAGSLLLVLLATILRRTVLGASGGLFAATVLILSTALLRYSTVLYSHVFSTLLVAGALCAMLAYEERPRPWAVFIAGFLLWSANVVEHPTLMLWPPVMAFLLSGTPTRSRWVGILAMVAAAGLIPLVLFFSYNTINFGGPLSIAHFHHRMFLYNRSPWTLFDPVKLPRQGYELLFARGDYTSLFGASPYLVISVLGVPWLLRRQPRVAWLALSSLVLGAIPGLIFTGDSGYDRDYRQILFGMPFLALFAAAGARVLWEQRPRALYAALGALAVSWAVVVHVAHVRHPPQAPMPLIANLPAALVNTSPLIVAAALGVAARMWWGGHRADDPGPGWPSG